MAKSLPIQRTWMQLTLMLSASILVGVMTGMVIGRLTPPAPRIYFIPPFIDNPNRIVMDVNRMLFVREFWPVDVPLFGDWAWSADGQKLAFSVRHNDGYDLVIMDADGRNQRGL